VLLIHHEFEGGIRYVLICSIIVFLQVVLCILSTKWYKCYS
jgi:hypothetical protein